MNNIIMSLIAISALIGGVDYLLNNKFGIGDSFKEAAQCLGDNILSMVGVICIIPLLTDLLTPLAIALYDYFGIDPSFMGSLFANNMGGYQLSKGLEINSAFGDFFGLIVSSTFGATLVYTIPVGLTMVKTSKHTSFINGLIIGIVFIPIGFVISGLLLGLNLFEIIHNSLPIIIVIGLIAISFFINKNKTTKFFIYFSMILKVVAIISLSIAAFKYISGYKIFNKIGDIVPSMMIVAEMGVVQLGAFPFSSILTKIFAKFNKNNSVLSSKCMATLFMCMINANSVFNKMNELSDEEIGLCSAFIVSSICLLTAHLSFTVSIDAKYLFYVIIAKVISAFISLIVYAILNKHKVSISLWKKTV